MKHSDSIIKIAPALVKAQSEIGKAAKTAMNPHLRSKYANLDSVWNAVAPALQVNELMVMQSPVISDDNKLHLETMIIHSSGEWIKEEMAMPIPKQDPQGYGSALSYARRYHLSAMLGVTQDDDDGHAAKASVKHSVRMIEQANDMDALQESFKEAYMNFKGDSAALKALTSAKDSRKTALSGNQPAFNPIQQQPEPQPESTPTAKKEIDGENF